MINKSNNGLKKNIPENNNSNQQNHIKMQTIYDFLYVCDYKSMKRKAFLSVINSSKGIRGETNSCLL